MGKNYVYEELKRKLRIYLLIITYELKQNTGLSPVQYRKQTSQLAA